jgi:uncharacterized protein (TIRG00374 family)
MGEGRRVMGRIVRAISGLRGAGAYVLALWLLFFAFGRHVHLVVVVGYGVANLLSALPLTPGGVGLVEAGLVGTCTAFGILASVAAVVVVLAHRPISLWLPVVAGIPAYLAVGRRSSVATASNTGMDA